LYVMVPVSPGEVVENVSPAADRFNTKFVVPVPVTRSSSSGKVLVVEISKLIAPWDSKD